MTSVLVEVTVFMGFAVTSVVIVVTVSVVLAVTSVLVEDTMSVVFAVATVGGKAIRSEVIMMMMLMFNLFFDASA